MGPIPRIISRHPSEVRGRLRIRSLMASGPARGLPSGRGGMALITHAASDAPPQEICEQLEAKFLALLGVKLSASDVAVCAQVGAGC